MAAVIRLARQEDICLDRGCVRDIIDRVGSRLGEDWIIDMIETLAVQTADLAAAVDRKDFGAITQGAAGAARLANRLGMLSLARVLRDLGAAAACADTPAIGAIWSRLVWVGDRSLAQIWQVPELATRPQPDRPCRARRED